MRVQFEAWMMKYKVDVVFAGHVHAYERSVSNPYNICLFIIVHLIFLIIYCWLIWFMKSV